MLPVLDHSEETPRKRNMLEECLLKAFFFYYRRQCLKPDLLDLSDLDLMSPGSGVGFGTT